MPDVLAFVSDLDGTLVDTRLANKSAYERAFDAAGFVFDRAAYDSAFGLNFEDLCDRLVPGATAEQRRAIAEVKADVYPEHFHEVRVNSGLVGMLRAAAARAIPVGLASTARRRNVDALLAHLGLIELFDVTVTAGDVARGKPAPDCYQAAVRRMNLAPSDVTVFEDSEVGVAAAAAAGCNVIKVVL